VLCRVGCTAWKGVVDKASKVTVKDAASVTSSAPVIDPDLSDCGSLPRPVIDPDLPAFLTSRPSVFDGGACQVGLPGVMHAVAGCPDGRH
jgi:hypothetical protein